MTRLRQAQIGLTALLSVGIAVHTTRLILGVEAVQDLVLTRAFDSAFAVVMLVAAVLLWRAKNAIDWRGMGERILFWVSFGYVALSVVLHGRSWFSEEATDVFAAFPYWYSAAFLAVIAFVLTLWWRLRPAACD
ncbi:hypothetical protein [Actibacterium sp. 188UL27-1]|uniref:hypothetical protein n=1 Tax=Actibacterium sp. 188UL27-1 TaxID=2786961 RepID=UPI00195E5B49|nr:hypothetical protein [Actibacterium sp. 188UL27-1]MBM7067563.1 hypothetical protein [Actibacterium sp. 188UL27-1]